MNNKLRNQVLPRIEDQKAYEEETPKRLSRIAENNN